MKRIWIMFIAVLVLLTIIPSTTYSQPPHPDSVRKIQEKINKGRTLRAKYDSLVKKRTEIAKKVFGPPYNDALLPEYVQADLEVDKAGKELTDQRNETKSDVVRIYQLTIPANANFCYDIECKGECVHGYCNEKCDIKLCEKAFQPRPWNGGGTPAWQAAIIKHEVEHKEQLRRNEWNTKSKAWLEYHAWQAALKCAEKTRLTEKEKDFIKGQKEIHQKRMNATKQAVPEWDKKKESSLPDKVIRKSLVITNYSDSPRMVNCKIKDSLRWAIDPYWFSLYLNPEQESTVKVTIFVPSNAEIGSKNEIFCLAQTETDTASDFTFIYVIPTVDVTAGPDTSGVRGQSIDLEFSVKNVGETSDSFRVAVTNPLGWPLAPSFFDVFVTPSESTNLISTVTIPIDAPFWTTNLIVCKATSKTDTIQTDEDWLAVRIDEVDICPLLIESPLGTINRGTVDTPKVWVYNSGHIQSFFDVFIEVDLPTPYCDSLKGLSLNPNRGTVANFRPLALNDTGTFNVKTYTQVPGGDADPNNDTLRGSFRVIEVPIPGWVKKKDVENQPSGKRVKGGGGITAIGDDNVYLILGNNTRDFLKYDGTSWTVCESIPKGPKDKKVKKGAYILSDDYIYVLKGAGTNEFYRYNTTTNTWESLPQPGFTKGVKGGFATMVKIGHPPDKYIYAGSGSNNKEWKRFNISSGAWEAAAPETLPVKKAKVGSGLTYDKHNNKIYFLQGGGKQNYFYHLDLSSKAPTWVMLESLPLAKPEGRKKKVKEGGCIEYFDKKVYAVKGGNTKEFWYYEPTGDSWHYVGEVGAGVTPGPQKGIKCGRSLTSNSDGLYCLIGNNTNELWFYNTPEIFAKSVLPAITGKTVIAQRIGLNVQTNPTRGLTTIYYSLPTKEVATLKIYNILGNIVYNEKSDKGLFTIRKLPAGIYILRFSTKTYKEQRKLIVVR